MQITFEVVYDEKSQELALHSECELYRKSTDESGNDQSIVLSPELAFIELIRDVAFGIIDPAVKGFWDSPVNLVDEYEEYHKTAIKKIADGEFGSDIRDGRP